MARQLIREPLLHFLLIGLLLFLLFDVVSGARGGEERRIVIDDATVAGLTRMFEATWQRAPTATEIRNLVDSRIREEILYREGIGLGLDRDDPVIRRRVVQKLDVLAEESGADADPGDADLEAYLHRNVARYARQAVLDFEQVLFAPARRGEHLDADVEAARAQLRAGTDPANIGDTTLLPAAVTSLPADLAARDFGDSFAASIVTLPTGEWQGPVTSSFGVHLVRVTRMVPVHVPPLSEVRAAVERDWEHERRTRARDTYYEARRQEYDVVIEASLPPAGTDTPRR